MNTVSEESTEKPKICVTAFKLMNIKTESYRNAIITADDFDVLAEIFLKHAVIKVRSMFYRLREIEFYLFSENHKDSYAHQQDGLKKYGEVYLHRHNNGTFKNGNYKSMDLTLGNESRWFGILVRGLNIISGDLETSIDGPCLCVNHMLTQYGVTDVQSYCNEFGDPTASHFATVYYSQQPWTESEIINGPRIGLSERYPDFKERKYRYGLSGHRYKKRFCINVQIEI